jgi:hypothetical protein
MDLKNISGERPSIDILVVDDVDKCNYTPFGSKLSYGADDAKIINLFGSRETRYMCMKYRDICRIRHERDSLYYYLKNHPEYIGDAVLWRLCEGYRNNHVDEAIHLAGKIFNYELDPDFVTRAFMHNCVIGVADLVELELCKIAVRGILYVMTGIAYTQDHSELHQWLVPLANDSNIRLWSGKNPKDVPDLAMSFGIDDRQFLSLPPPVSILPNNNNTCYMVSTFTVLLSIPVVVKALFENRPRCIEGATYINTLRMYAWTLTNGGLTIEEMKVLNENLMKQDIFSGFNHGRADDSSRVVMLLLESLKRWSPQTANLFSEIYIFPSLAPTENVKTVTFTEPSVKLSYDIEERENTLSIVPCEIDLSSSITHNHMIYSDSITGNVLGTFQDIVCSLVTVATDIILLCHNICANDCTRKFAIPANITVCGKLYSFYGATLYDNKYSDGHYISMITSNTSMYFYDPQYMYLTEDPREYRPRILCYVKA